jgi:Mg-chelatase subunit ChlD
MKTNLCPIVLLVAGLGCPVAAASATDNKPAAKPRIEVCFVLDTTGSMSGLIEGAKQKIWSIANEMARAKPTPEIRVGLVGYRDRGDEYVLRSYDLTNDLDAVFGQLQSFQANGGGDTPESVNEALECAVKGMSWSAERSVLKTIFLVGDSPPHMDYANGPKYPDICKDAVKKDLLINTVQCGTTTETVKYWQEIAQLGEGNYAAIAQSGNMAVVSTPMDAELAELNRKIGTTLVAYGGEGARRTVAAKQFAAENAPAAVAADRLTFNARYGVAVQGEGELLDSLAAGRVSLSSVKKDELPADLQKLDEPQLKAKIEEKQKERAELQGKIQQLAQQRENYLAAERNRLAASHKSDSFDAKVASFIQTQAARKGITY